MFWSHWIIDVPGTNKIMFVKKILSETFTITLNMDNMTPHDLKLFTDNFEANDAFCSLVHNFVIFTRLGINIYIHTIIRFLRHLVIAKISCFSIFTQACPELINYLSLLAHSWLFILYSLVYIFRFLFLCLFSFCK